MVLRAIDVLDGTYLLVRTSFFEDNGETSYSKLEDLFARPIRAARTNEDAMTTARYKQHDSIVFRLTEHPDDYYRPDRSLFSREPGNMDLIWKIIEAVEPTVPDTSKWSMATRSFEAVPCTSTLLSLALTCRFFYELLKPHLTNIMNQNSAIWRNRPLIIADEDPSAQPRSVARFMERATGLLAEDVGSPIPMNMQSSCFTSHYIQPVRDHEPERFRQLFRPWMRHLRPNFVHRKEGWILRNFTLKQYITYEGLRRVDVPAASNNHRRRRAPQQWFLGMVVPPGQTHWYLGQALLAKILRARFGKGVNESEYDGGWATHRLEICRRKHLDSDQKAGQMWQDVSTEACLAIEFLTNTNQFTLFPDELADCRWDSWNYCGVGGARLAKLMEAELMEAELMEAELMEAELMENE